MLVQIGRLLLALEMSQPVGLQARTRCDRASEKWDILEIL